MLRRAGFRIPVVPVFQEVEAVLHHRGYVMLRGAGVQIPVVPVFQEVGAILRRRGADCLCGGRVEGRKYHNRFNSYWRYFWSKCAFTTFSSHTYLVIQA